MEMDDLSQPAGEDLLFSNLGHVATSRSFMTRLRKQAISLVIV